MACWRSWPVTISLASSESKLPPITSPCWKPPSTRMPGAGRRVPDGQRAGGGQEVAARVLAVDPELDGVPAQRRVVVAELLAVGDPELLADQVDARDLLGHRVLDLQAGVDLEEGDGAVLADEELAGAGAVVAGLAHDRLAGGVEPLDLLVGQERRGRLLDELLVAALQRAVAGGDDHDVAVLVGQHLGLDVPRAVEVLLDEALAAAEGGHRLAHGRVVELGDLLHRARDLQAATAAAEGRLDGDRAGPTSSAKATTSSAPETGSAVPRTWGAPARAAMCRAETLSPRSRIADGGGPIQVSPASMTAWAKSAFSDRNP